MVKSPWKLLTGLLSRGKAADQHDVGQDRLAEIPNESEGHEANSTAVETSIGGESEPEPEPSAASQVDKADVGSRQELPPSMAADVPDTILGDGASAFATDRTVLMIGVERRHQQDRAQPATRRKVKAEKPGDTRDVKRAITQVKQATPDEPDPIRALDSEIQALRSQLAAKLRIQNDHLRQLLSRFEPK